MDIAQFQTIYEYETRHWWFLGQKKVVFDCLEGWAAGRRGLRILDVGCGTGLNMEYLSAYGRVFGVDISPHAIEFCRKRNLLTVGRASAMALPFRNGAFDLVTCLGVMYHRDIPDDGVALKEFHRVCGPGGAVLITSPALPALGGKHDVAMCTVRRYYLKDLEQKMRRAGFAIRKASYIFMFVTPIVWLVRRAQRLSRSAGPPRNDFSPLPSLLNRFLVGVMSLEAWLIRRSRLPFGVTVLCMGEKELRSRENAAA